MQPANLGLRNAWFAGGVEWNIGTFGHTPLTCSPLHAIRVEQPDGTPVLRLYELERMRRLVFQVDAYLPEGSAVLFVHVRIRNPNDHEVPLFWWTDIAVPETPGTRVIAPAVTAHRMAGGVLRQVTIPEHDGEDSSYPGRCEGATDLFYDIPDGVRPWIAAVDAEGAGLLHTTTQGRVRGRKQFRWGNGVGGCNWQQWLSGPGSAYLEIQVGLTRTQLEHVPFPGGASWSWMEAYGAGELPVVEVHSSEWSRACAAAAVAVDELIPAGVLDAELTKAAAWADAPPAKTLQRGSGWGALEGLDLPGTPFGQDTIGRDQNSWRMLVETGTMPTPSSSLPPSSYAVGPRWLTLLEQANPSWFTLLHLGVARWHSGDREGAKVAWVRSLAADRNAWALRNLAMAEALDGDLARAAEGMLQAHRLAPGLRPLTIETLTVLVEAGRPGDALAVVNGLDAADYAHGRVRYLECVAALAFGDLRRAERLLTAGIVVDDLKEGESLPLDSLWWAYHERRIAAGQGVLTGADRISIRRDNPLPCLYDFRM